MRFLSGIERALSAADYALLLQIVPGEAASALPAYERLAAAGRVDGFLLTDVEARDPRFGLLAAAAIPVVLAGRPAGESPFPCVETRHEEGIAPAVEHLVSLGHERIGFLGGRPEYEHVQAREAAWRSALAAAGSRPVPWRRWRARSRRSRRRGAAIATGDARSAALALLRDDAHRDRVLERRAGDRGDRRRALGRAAPCPTTSRSWASTTPRWPRSPYRR